ncbi:MULTISPECIES: nucleotidyltransferase family protein [Croceitalea]|uniref:Nucleotidyltransferase family protein n=1 Tax=Croceitalea vernalis TaxID=3075599 RepID=A0ABU3BH67_9FLAO|nr:MULTISPECIES: nucleotidyltransferase family protein [unclassified Croceitalea]MDT0539704.1 nucleotidyltransferase family protein [Croceitalea sp. P059]MDT0621518.1 nucleotidyltransferase family protein [Croceitalea sp. P007]
MVKNDNIAVLILAAGASSRMGQPKQLLPWGETTLLNHAIAQAKKISKNVFVVLGANQDLIKSSLTRGVIAINNPFWKMGMGTSIACGISEILKLDEFSSVLVMLSDQPLLDSNYLTELKNLFFNSDCKIAATVYQANKGVPAVFDHSILNQLTRLNKDYGARRLMKEFESELKGLEPEGNEIDIDTFETYQKLLSNSK